MPKHSIVIYASHRRLEFYEDGRLIRHYPVAVGKSSTPTPLGRYTVVTKTMSPGGVFGSRWLGLSLPGYGIHGTNNPSSIGQAVSKGCIRMHNSDVESLFQRTEVGTPVTIYK